MPICCAPITDEEKEYILKHFTIEDGVIHRDDRKNSEGSIEKDGYLVLKVKKHRMKAHRIAWLLYYGEWPPCEIDHINRVKTDNRKENLRLSDRQQQNRNKDFLPNPDTGAVGIYLDKATKGLKKRYTFKHNKNTFRFYTLEDAVKAKEELNASA